MSRLLPRFSIFSAALLIALGVCPAQAKTKTGPRKADAPVAAAPVAPITPHYYYNIEIDPRYQYVGTGEMTEETATRANCYRFFYNDDGRIKQIQYRRAGIPMSDPLFGVTNIDFDYQPGIERHWFHTAQGQPMASHDGIQGEELTLNPAGFATDVANLDASGARVRDTNGVIHYQRTLDDKNRVVIGRRIGLLGTAITDSGGHFETRTTYDEQGHPLERANFDSSGAPLDDENGVATVRTTYTFYPDATQTVTGFYDATGMPAEQRGTGVHEIQSTRDARGFLVNESFFDGTGAPCLNTDNRIHERRYQYDDRGNMVSESFYDADGHPHDGKMAGYARVVYQYDDKNRVIERSYFGDDGKPQINAADGAAVIRQEYDPQGRIVHFQYFDGLGHPTPSTRYGAPALRINFDNGWTYVGLRDEHDNPTKNPVGGYTWFSFQTGKDRELTSTNRYYNQRRRLLAYFPRVAVINPHLYALSQPENWKMKYSARLGAAAAGLGALIACGLALRKASHRRRRKVYVPSPAERLLGWFSVLAILEGTLRFFLTVYWWWLDHQNGRMGQTIYVIEAVILVFFAYRLFRLRVTMRVLNISKEDVHRLVRDFLTAEGQKTEWDEALSSYITPPLDVRIRYFQGKDHAYLTFTRRGDEGWDLAKKLAAYIRTHASPIHAPLTSRTIKVYYRTVATAYFLLSGTAFYTLWQLLKDNT